MVQQLGLPLSIPIILLLFFFWKFSPALPHYRYARLVEQKEMMTCGTSSTNVIPGKGMWSLECTDWYNRGKWTLREIPLSWNMTFGYHRWKSSSIIPADRCEHLGKSAEFQSLTNAPDVFEAEEFFRAALQISRRKRNYSSSTTTVISFVGDSVMRQTFAVLLEALGIPKDACIYTPRIPNKKKTLFPSECNWTTPIVATGRRSLNLVLRMHNNRYGTDGWPKKAFFAQADIVLMNFGVWYMEQQGISQKTNHTPLTYLPRMALLLEEIQNVRKPHQLIVFRESSEMLTTTSDSLVQLSQRLRALLVHHHIPLITRHSSRNFTQPESQLFYDKVHFCEPSVPLAWITVFTYILRDWAAFLSRSELMNL